ncbi:hypothetical protein [Cetobacterium sp.]|uniref:hypothetical protein n=1 Tax=Cetobacterium sp. TaxID=2071632 RepID=UPI003F4033AD
MKKLLLASLLSIGATSFGAEVVEMGVSAGTTDTILPITVRGKVVAATGMQIVITPTVASSADGRSLDLNFGDIQQDTVNKIPMKAGEFEIQITHNGTPVKFAKAPEVKLQGGTEVESGTNHTLQVNNTAGNELLTLAYNYSGAMSGAKLFKGRVEVTPDMQNNNGVGLFSATGVNLGIKVTNQDESGTPKA